MFFQAPSSRGLISVPAVGIAFLLCFLPVCHATLTVNDQLDFDSMPAVFGMPWLNNVEYRAHLQFLDSRPFLCGEDAVMLSLPLNDDELTEEDEVDPASDDQIIGDRRILAHTHRNHSSTSPHNATGDDLPVAVLISRGACSFEEKAREAMLLPNVDFAIIYDDRARTHLVPMSASEPDGITLGMMFVSYSTGVQLRQMLHDQSNNSTDDDGLVITMDNIIPDYSGYNSEGDAQEWVMAAMSGFFSFVAFLGCMAICVQAGFTADATGIMGGEKLMTEEQVLKLPCVNYGSGSITLPDGEQGKEGGNDGDVDTASASSCGTSPSSHQHTSCAICIEEYGEGDKLRQLPCQHEFHTECILPWLTERHSSCPLCKHDVISQESEEEDPFTWAYWMRWPEITRHQWLQPGRTLVPGEDDDEAEGAATSSEEESPEEAFSDEPDENEAFVDEPDDSAEEAVSEMV